MHPDRVPQNAKKLATEKFQLMVALHAVLSNKEKRRMYDEKGMIDNYDANDSLPKANCKITGEHVQECKNKFKGTSWIDFYHILHILANYLFELAIVINY